MEKRGKKKSKRYFRLFDEIEKPVYCVEISSGQSHRKGFITVHKGACGFVGNICARVNLFFFFSKIWKQKFQHQQCRVLLWQIHFYDTFQFFYSKRWRCWEQMTFCEPHFTLQKVLTFWNNKINELFQAIWTLNKLMMMQWVGSTSVSLASGRTERGLRGRKRNKRKHRSEINMTDTAFSRVKSIRIPKNELLSHENALQFEQNIDLDGSDR